MPGAKAGEGMKAAYCITAEESESCREETIKLLERKCNMKWKLSMKLKKWNIFENEAMK